jgi:small subunit ribosomal protein S7
MSRRRVAEVREVLPDPKYGSIRVAKFINVIMQSGKKAVAEKIVYQAMEHAAERRGTTPGDILEAAIYNVRPTLEVKSRRVGGANYQVPIEVRGSRQLALAMRWIKEAARKRPERSMAERLAAELAEASMERGGAVKKRDDTHRMAEANKAFAHFRW